MKKLLTLLFSSIVLTSTAQDILPFTFGPIASITSTSLNTNYNLQDQVAGTGYNIGGFARLKVLILYAEGELTYATKEVSITTHTSSFDHPYSTTTFSLEGVDASIIAGIKILPLGSLANVRIFAGYNWNEYSSVTYKVDGISYSADNVESTNNSVIAGVGCDVLKLAVNLKYLFGLTNLASSGSTDVKTGIVNLSLAYMLK